MRSISTNKEKKPFLCWRRIDVLLKRPPPHFICLSVPPDGKEEENTLTAAAARKLSSSFFSWIFYNLLRIKCPPYRADIFPLQSKKRMLLRRFCRLEKRGLATVIHQQCFAPEAVLLLRACGKACFSSNNLKAIHRYPGRKQSDRLHFRKIVPRLQMKQKKIRFGYRDFCVLPNSRRKIKKLNSRVRFGFTFLPCSAKAEHHHLAAGYGDLSVGFRHDLFLRQCQCPYLLGSWRPAHFCSSDSDAEDRCSGSGNSKAAGKSPGDRTVDRLILKFIVESFYERRKPEKGMRGEFFIKNDQLIKISEKDPDCQ